MMNTVLTLSSVLLNLLLAVQACDHPQTSDYCELALKYCKDDCRNECVKECKVKCDKEYGTKCSMYDDFDACDMKETCEMRCPSGCRDASCDICDSITDDCVNCSENPFFNHLKQYHGL